MLDPRHMSFRNGTGINAVAKVFFWVQVYGFGLSEEFIGEFMRQTGRQVPIATKYAPLPWRFTSGSVVDACKCVSFRFGSPLCQRFTSFLT